MSTASRPLTVVHVIHSLGAGGAETMLVELARSAAPAGIRLVVVGISDALSSGIVDNRVVPRLREFGATVHEMHCARYDPAAVLCLARPLKDERADVVHTHLKHADVVGGAAAQIARIPWVSTLHVIDVPTTGWHRFKVRVAAFVRRRLCDEVIALSDAQRRWYAQYAGPDSPMTLLPNGIPHRIWAFISLSNSTSTLPVGLVESPQDRDVRHRNLPCRQPSHRPPDALIDPDGRHPPQMLGSLTRIQCDRV